MPGVTETVTARLRHLRGFAPLLDAWVNTGLLPDAEADLVLLASEATRMRWPLSIALPGGSSALAAAIALHSAVETAVHPGRYPVGPTALIANSAERTASLAMNVDSIPVAASLGAVRLRADGQAQAVSGNRISALSTCQRLLYVSPRARWPSVDVTLGVAVVDKRSLGINFEHGLRWAQRHARIVHVVADLDTSEHASSFEVDWPHVAEQAKRWNRAQSWPIHGEIRLYVTDSDPDGLLHVNERFAHAARIGGAWPEPLSAAWSLSRALTSVAVPLGLYDACTVGSIALPFATRIEHLQESRPSSFPIEWSVFAETDWASLKRRLLDVAAQMEGHNAKAEQIGIAIEGLLAEGRDVDVWADSEVHRRALQSHLLSAGFGIRPDDLASGRLAIRTLSAAHRASPSDRAAVISSLPGPWQRPAILAAGVSGPLVVVAYPSEAGRAVRYFDWMLNGIRPARHQRRVVAMTRILGPGLLVDAIPEPIRIRVARYDADADVATPLREYSEDAAEFAALADDEWLALLAEVSEPADSSSCKTVPAIAFLVDPGPEILLLGEHTIVDRVVAGRLRPLPATQVAPGMQLLGARASGGVFAAIRPYLDRLHGIGTQVWLEQWDEGLRSALKVARGANGLAEQLVSDGATIRAQAVASWASPYRIGPRDPLNVKRVGIIGDHEVVTHHHNRIHAVMRGVRIEHGRIGRHLAAALRRHLNDDVGAFDEIEERLGVAVENILGNISVYVIRDRLASGTAESRALGRAHSIAMAETIFEPQGS